MRFVVRCAGSPSPPTEDSLRDDVRIELYGQAAGTGRITAGASILKSVRRAGLQPSTRAWDLLTIALAATVADAATPRDRSPDGWTRDISLNLAVAEPAVWEPHLPLLTKALNFLTTDRWRLEFAAAASVPFQPSKTATSSEADCVALLSGGLDSLVGAIDLTGAGVAPYFVSHTVRGDAVKQASFAERLGPELPHIRLNHSANTSAVAGSDETSQRVRSLIFIAYATLVASTLTSTDGHPVDLYVNENGFIALNPPLTPMRIGSLSTRTAHPRFLGLLQELFDEVGLHVRLVNPYRLRTKGQMLADCRDQAVLAELAALSTSCGRFQRYNYRHCGRCLPCQVRRAAFLRWGVADETDYVFEDLGQADDAHAAFDDVRAVAIARLSVEQDGFDRWAGGALAWVPVDERSGARAMLQAGLAELGTLHDRYRVL